MPVRTRFIALIAVSLVVLIAWFAVVFKPGQHKLSDVRAQVVTTQAQVSQLTLKLQELQALKKNAPALRAQAVKFTHALPAEPAVSDFIRDVQDVASEAKIDFLSVAPSLPAAPTGAAAPAPAPAPATSPAPTAAPTPTPAPGSATVAPPAEVTTAPLKSITVAITANGKFFAIEDFVSKMETLKRALRIDTFALTGGGGSTAVVGQSPELSLNLQVEIFMNTPVAPTTTTPSGTTGGL